MNIDCQIPAEHAERRGDALGIIKMELHRNGLKDDESALPDLRQGGSGRRIDVAAGNLPRPRLHSRMRPCSAAARCVA
jgi:hypothetical protein